jgi:RNA polymerase sigma-70 factor, ECF subfamily
VILFKFIEGKSNAEVAALLGKNEGAIKSLQHRALQALHRILEREYGYETSPL